LAVDFVVLVVLVVFVAQMDVRVVKYSSARLLPCPYESLVAQMQRSPTIYFVRVMLGWFISFF
jgi:hypothetical protein